MAQPWKGINNKNRTQIKNRLHRRHFSCSNIQANERRPHIANTEFKIPEENDKGREEERGKQANLLSSIRVVCARGKQSLSIALLEASAVEKGKKG
jgi:hypothetical protein